MTPSRSVSTPKAHASQHGITLLEVLVALAIVAIALASITRAASTAITTNALLQEKTLALIAAESHLAELQISGIALSDDISPRPCPPDDAFVCTTQTTVAGTGLRRVVIDVYTRNEPDHSLATLATLLPE
ncbi:type II secretion system minor pseudopilin GspI [Paenalcaligenes niemegkensis]|uniref:type II secretion system minor pseudopilin GspI n=1 Tax=Paenalcaligenes niemegkensis TaxID=2895469 RepID=UPI001EE93CEF|nr:type II secretion system minor pseudopilin GspI [Paenalcaligenes niemegkensis]MCQ9617047.1 type II secretion system minor pseudopilin GspI [Paenalcaligenes niemegkensis]